MEDQERELVEMLLSTAESGQFTTKGELLAEVERRYGKIMTYCWIKTFLARHTEHITIKTIHPQEDTDSKLCSNFSMIILTSSSVTLLE
jgi:hypothetical protein